MTLELSDTHIQLLERIATTLERIEIVLEEKQNRTLEGKEARS
jgi:hypothetical protein